MVYAVDITENRSSRYLAIEDNGKSVATIIITQDKVVISTEKTGSVEMVFESARS